MKCLSLILALFIVTTSKSQINLVPIPGSTLQVNERMAGVGFILDFHFAYQPSCPKYRVLWKYINTKSKNLTQDLLMNGNGGQWGNTAPSNCPTTAEYLTPLQTTPSIPGVTNNQLNLTPKNGKFNDQDTLRFIATLIHYDANGIQCGSTITSDTFVMRIRSTNTWDIKSEVITNPSQICLGGYIKYKLSIFDYGGIGKQNLCAPSIKVILPPNTTLEAVLTNNIIPVSASSSAPGTNLNYMLTTGFNYDLTVILKFNCTTPNPILPVTFNPQFILNSYTIKEYNMCPNPSLPITSATIYRDSFSIPTKVSNNCCLECNHSPVVLYKHTNLMSSEGFCKNSCALINYSLTIDNENNPSGISNSTIIDTIPNHINVEFISTPELVGSPCTMSVTYTNSVGATVIQNFNPAPLELNVSTLTGWSTTVSKVKIIRWNYTNFPAWTKSFILIHFRIANTAIVGSEIHNYAYGNFDSYMSIGHTYRTVVECTPKILTWKFICDNNAFNICSHENTALNGSIMSYRINVMNVGLPLIPITVTDVLPIGMTYVPGSSKMCLGLNPFSESSAFSVLPDPDISGQTIKYITPPLGNCASLFYSIVFQVKINQTAIVGVYTNTCTGSSGNYEPHTSSATNTKVFANYELNGNLKVSCDSINWYNHIKAKLGDNVYYKYKIKNIGNVPVRNIGIFNNVPRGGDQVSTLLNTAWRGSTLTQTKYATISPIYSSAGITYAANYPNFQTLSCPLVLGQSAGCAPNSTSISLANAFQILTDSTLLNPGDSISFVTKNKITNATLNSRGINDFGFRALRSDINQYGPIAISNRDTVLIDSVSCVTPCLCGGWESKNKITYTKKGVIVTESIDCNSSKDIEIEKAYQINLGSFLCSGTLCNSTFTVTTNYPGYTRNGNVLNFPALDSKKCDSNYEIVIQPNCGPLKCPPCKITFRVKCCVKIEKDTIVCNNGVYTYSFCLKSFASFPVKTIRLALPTGVTITGYTLPTISGLTANTNAGFIQYNFSTPLSVSSNSVCTFTLKLSGVSVNQTVCFGITAYSGALASGIRCGDSSSGLPMFKCITIPPCPIFCAKMVGESINCSKTDRILSFKIKNLSSIKDIAYYKVENVTCAPYITSGVLAIPFKTLDKDSISNTINFVLPANFPSVSKCCYRIIIYSKIVDEKGNIKIDSCIGDTVCHSAPICQSITKSTSFLDSNEDSSVEVYPNPANNVLNIICKGLFQVASEIQILSIDGRQQMSIPATKDSTNYSINIRALTSGNYIIKYVKVDGSTYVHKFMKE